MYYYQVCKKMKDFIRVVRQVMGFWNDGLQDDWCRRYIKIEQMVDFVVIGFVIVFQSGLFWIEFLDENFISFILFCLI